MAQSKLDIKSKLTFLLYTITVMLIRAGDTSRPAMRGAPMQFWIAALFTLYALVLALIRCSTLKRCPLAGKRRTCVCACATRTWRPDRRRTKLQTSSMTRRRHIATPPATRDHRQSARVNLNRDRKG